MKLKNWQYMTGMEPDELRHFVNFPEYLDKPLVNLQIINQNKKSST